MQNDPHFLLLAGLLGAVIALLLRRNDPAALEHARREEQRGGRGELREQRDRLAGTLRDVGGIAAQTTYACDALDRLTQVADPKVLTRPAPTMAWETRPS
ncbi:hypothetical protein [Xanthomonas theicola]|uniref:Uncharacterized protein n=1 Tax=Xanthomonas theicola TaxID=56464 RepID=A0A2S6ZDG4_9XANT|nr:hypothetical protein [Xanthomonas theicola]PPT89237.1 hypothetical protein XthCFBP4691_13655 [Xanthomonas theicola]